MKTFVFLFAAVLILSGCSGKKLEVDDYLYCYNGYDKEYRGKYIGSFDGYIFYENEGDGKLWRTDGDCFGFNDSDIGKHKTGYTEYILKNLGE